MSFLTQITIDNVALWVVLLICLGVLLLKWLLPRLWRSIRKAIRSRKRQKKESTPPPRGYEKKKKISKGAKR